MTILESLRQKLAQVAGDMDALAAATAAENRGLTAEEQTKFDALDAEYRSLEGSVATQERAEEIRNKLASPLPRQTETTPGQQIVASAVVAGAQPRITGGGKVAHTHENHGFDKGFGQFLMKVRESAMGRTDPRLLVNSVTTWAGETVGADGGFALPPQFLPNIMSLVQPVDSFVRALNAIPTQSDIITVPKDEDAPWSTTAITAARTAEGTAITASKASIGQLKVPMYGIKTLVHVDEKSLRDMTFLAAYVERKMGEKIRWKVENYIMNGTGENEPLGIVNAPGLYSVSASDGTSTGSAFSAYDIGLMEASALAGAGGFWIGHPLIKAQLRTLTMGTAGFPLIQSDWKNGQQIDTLLGYPYFSSEAAKAYGNPCDLTFVKPDGYLLAFEAAGPQTATTIAFAFDQNLQSFRTTLYMGGAPTLSATVTRADGSSKASNLVTLAGSRT